MNKFSSMQIGVVLAGLGLAAMVGVLIARQNKQRACQEGFEPSNDIIGPSHPKPADVPPPPPGLRRVNFYATSI